MVIFHWSVPVDPANWTFFSAAGFDLRYSTRAQQWVAEVRWIWEHKAEAEPEAAEMTFPLPSMYGIFTYIWLIFRQM